MAAGSTVTIYSDGNAKFEASVWTNHTHSGDTWQHILTFLDFRGLELFSSPTLYGPNHMNDGNPPPHYKWGPVWFKFDPANSMLLPKRRPAVGAERKAPTNFTRTTTRLRSARDTRRSSASAALASAGASPTL